jgi:pYEATS domain-containing protein involved in immunity
MSGSTGRCARCDGVLETQDVFCGQCGAPRQATALPPRAPEGPPTGPPEFMTTGAAEAPRVRRSGRRLWTVLFGALAIVALAAGILRMLQPTPAGEIVSPTPETHRAPEPPPEPPAAAGTRVAPEPVLTVEDPRDALVLTNTAELTGRRYRDGKAEYAWVAYLDLDGPPGTRDEVLSQVSHVRYLLHPSFRPNDDVIVRDRALAGFPLSMSGWGTFDLRAEVHFQDGTTRVLIHHLRF